MRNSRALLLLLLPLLALAVWIAWPTDPAAIGDVHFTTHLGLDLVGGVQVLLEADLSQDIEISSTSMDTAREIIESRANGMLGVGEAVVQQVGERRISVELPGEADPQKAIDVIGETGQLEFVDMGQISAQDSVNLIGQVLVTDYPPSPDVSEGTAVYHTVMIGAAIEKVGSQPDNFGEPQVVFTLDAEGTRVFADYTSSHVGSFLAIVLDKQVISAPRVAGAITSGSGSITGNFTLETAANLATTLRYGSLPIPFTVSQSRTVGPSLGQDCLEKSLYAGAIGLGLVLLFMAIYYRFPGVLADIALGVYVVLTFALFKVVPVTLTLPGIAGFILSIGVAVDANILIFERMREELRSGRHLDEAIDQGWSRAWPSIRDSNISTLLTCAILFWFGSLYGASVVIGFATTLALGVLVSLFTAILITRSLLHLALDNIRITNRRRWFGV
ncbi:MAG TPA: protein translocase subunit SecD [Anaerolineales bacterium]|nr:protein translocase subunit SecD [Anaerolineales bacterium]